MRKVLVICGATASGKTSLAAECAKKLNTEIVSADSLLIYRDLNIGTAKPTLEERQGVVHHMIDVVDAKSEFSVSDYEKNALPVVQKLLNEDKTPIICGGTGFYINSLLYKSGFGGNGANEEVRKKYESVLEEKGKSYLHELLEKVDSESASILHENDTKRVIRALEIFETTGKKKSEQHDERIPRFDFKCVAVNFEREKLYERIEKRVDIMFESGLLEEIDGLLEKGVQKDDQCMQGIGYKEVIEGRETGLSNEEIKELIKKNTRNYAKRQITYFKRMENLTWLSPEDATAENVISLLED